MMMMMMMMMMSVMIDHHHWPPGYGTPGYGSVEDNKQEAVNI